MKLKSNWHRSRNACTTNCESVDQMKFKTRSTSLTDLEIKKAEFEFGHREYFGVGVLTRTDLHIRSIPTRFALQYHGARCLLRHNADIANTADSRHRCCR
jgi:hypothetical protein